MKQSFYLSGCMCIVLLAGACRTPGIQPQKNQNMDSQIIVTTTSPKGGVASVSSPPVYIYKTREDYSHLVPVIMNDARTTIVSYPHPRDLRIGDKLCLPTLLEKGYWLDNRGIGRNVVFLSYTYEEYSQLGSAPSMEELMTHIHDKHPLTEWHECGRRADYKNIVSELNKLIEQGFLQK